MKKANTPFSRFFAIELSNKLKTEKLFRDKLLPDIKTGDVFPAIRRDNIDFYYKGGRLFQFDKKGFKTNIKYAAVIRDTDNPDLYEVDFNNDTLKYNFYDTYSRIKENCGKFAGVEASGVSDIYRKYSYLLFDKNIVVLDIELSFAALDDINTSDRIDILLYSKETLELRLVEAKHYSNPHIWSRTTPKVINQIERYQKQLLTKETEIILAFTSYIKVLNNLFDISLPYPNKVYPHVILLIFGFGNNQKKGRLEELIIQKKEYKGIYYYNKGDTYGLEIKQLWNAMPLK